jgi:hypothetical protein
MMNLRNHYPFYGQLLSGRGTEKRGHDMSCPYNGDGGLGDFFGFEGLGVGVEG